MSNQAEVQRRYRARQSAKNKAMESTLRKISDLVEGKTGPVATDIRALINEALGDS